MHTSGQIAHNIAWEVFERGMAGVGSSIHKAQGFAHRMIRRHVLVDHQDSWSIDQEELDDAAKIQGESKHYRIRSELSYIVRHGIWQRSSSLQEVSS